MNNEPIQEVIAQRIRAMRKARGWSLAQVERRSKGAISAVALGSYERCDRALSLRRLNEIATFFEVPLHYLLDEAKTTSSSTLMTPLVVDLRRLKTLSHNLGSRSDVIVLALTTLIASIANKRGDWNSEVMSLRQSDLQTLSLMTMKTEEDVKQNLTKFKLLLTTPNQP